MTSIPRDNRINGHIEGIRLSRRTWTALENDGIRTLAQLAEIAPQIERIVPDVGLQAGQLIRAELARLAPASLPAGIHLGSPGILRESAVQLLVASATGAKQIQVQRSPASFVERADPVIVVVHTICPHCGSSDIQATERVVPAYDP